MGYKAVVEREIKHFASNPLAWFVSFIIPILMCLLICAIFGKGVPSNLPIGVIDNDNSQISRNIVRNLNTLQSCEVKYRLNNLAEGKELLIKGKIYGIVLIPKDFQKDLNRFLQPQLVFYYNNQRILIGGIVSKDVTAMVQSMLVGIDAKIKNKKSVPYEEALKQSNLINVVEHIRSNPYFNYLYLISLAAFGHLIQISMAITSVWAVGSEFKFFTIKEWLKTADNSVIKAYLGKMTPYFFIFIILFLTLYILYFGICQVPYFGSIITGIIATILFIIACLSMGTVFMSINGNFRLGLSLCAFYVAIGFALAGVTFPVMAMPKAVQAYTTIMPLNYWVQVMLDQTLRQIPYIYDFKYFIPPVIISLTCLLSLHRLKKLAFDESRWF